MAVRHRVVRLECQDAAEAERGPIEIALSHSDDAQVVVRFRVVGAEPRGRAQRIVSLIEPALLHQCDSEIVEEHPFRGATLEGATRKLVTASSRLAEGIADTPVPRPELGVTGLVLDGLAVELLGLGQGAEALETGGESRNVGRMDHDGARRGPPEQSPDHGPAIRSSAGLSARVVETTCLARPPRVLLERDVAQSGRF